MLRRLTIFGALGAALFLFAPRTDRAIHIDGALVRGDQSGARIAEDEVLVREAKRLGLAEHDPIVRRRLIEKALFYAEDVDARVAAPVGDDEARALFEQNPARFASAPSVHFVHVFASTSARATALLPTVSSAMFARAANLDAIEVDGIGEIGEIGELGDPFPLPHDVDATTTRVASLYGASFADALAKAPLGAWSGPIESRFGFHDVLVLARKNGARSFAEAKADVVRAIDRERRARARQEFVDQALARYRVDVDGVRITSMPIPDEPAQSSPSFED
jgi:hypothetical protein